MEKMESFVKFLCFLPKLWSVNCPKRCNFYNFVLTSARNLSLLEQFTYMHLKVLTTPFQKMVWFIGVGVTVRDILVIKISTNMLTQQKFNNILQFQILLFPNSKSYHNKQNHFLKMRNETFQMYICTFL